MALRDTVPQIGLAGLTGVLVGIGVFVRVDGMFVGFDVCWRGCGCDLTFNLPLCLTLRNGGQFIR